MNSLCITWLRLAVHASVLTAALTVLPSPTVAQTTPADSTHRAIPRARNWPEGDVLFRRDARWLGGDGAYSIDLGGNRILWLFGDSFVASSPGEVRWETKMVRNTIGIQQGHDPANATMTYYWRTSDGMPAPFFPGTDTSWYWPGHGVRVNDRLLLFMMNLRKVEGGFGFEGFGWSAVTVENPDEEPLNWNIRPANVPAPILGVLVGSASVLYRDNYVYAFGAEEPAIHDIFLVRWPAEDAASGNLLDPEWWCAIDSTWVRQTLLTRRPVPVLRHAATEFTVHYDSAAARFVQIQTMGFGAASLTIRTSPTLTGPWSSPSEIYTPPESGRRGVMVYSGKAHPWAKGADLILTYCTNAFSLTDLVFDTSLYYPRFVRVDVPAGMPSRENQKEQARQPFEPPRD